MLKKVLLIIALMVSYVEAVDVWVNIEEKKAGVQLNGYNEQNNDWVAIYEQGAENIWDNVIRWAWFSNIDDPVGNSSSHYWDIDNFDDLPNGDYEVRFFKNNTYNVSASDAFTINNNGGGGNDEVKLIITDDDSNIYLTVNHQEDVKHFSNYINSDENENTGYLNKDGTEYLIQDGNFYKYTGDGNSWTWDYIRSLSVQEGDTRKTTLPKESIQFDHTLSIVAVGSDVNWNNIKTLASVSYSSNGGGNQDIGSIESININDVNGNVQIEANGNFADIGYYEIYIDTDNNANNGDNGSEYVVTNNGWTAEYIDGNWTNWNQIDVEEQNDKITVTVDKNVYNVHAVTYDGDWNILFSKDKGFDGNGGGGDDNDILNYIHQEYNDEENYLKTIFGNSYNETYKVFEKSIDLFESHNNEGAYEYAVFLPYDYADNGLTVGRIFTTRNGNNPQEHFSGSDAYKVINNFKLTNANSSIVTLVDDYMNNMKYVNNYIPSLNYIKDNYATVEGDNDEYKVIENYKNDSFISEFAYEWNQLGDNKNFKLAQDIIVFEDVYKKVLDFLTSIDGLNISNIKPLTFYILADATVYHGSETPEQIRNGNINGININNYDLNILNDQKSFLNALLDTELFNDDGQDHRRETLKYMLNIEEKYSFTYNDIKNIYDNVDY